MGVTQGSAQSDREKQIGRWETVERIAPLFTRMLEPLSKTAPQLLSDKAVTDALFAIALVNWPLFSKKTLPFADPARLSDDRICDIWRKPCWFWRTKRDEALLYQRFTDRDYLWPKLETALRHLIPGLSEKFNVTRSFKATGVLKDPPCRIFLATGASLIQLVAPAPKRW